MRSSQEARVPSKSMPTRRQLFRSTWGWTALAVVVSVVAAVIFPSGLTRYSAFLYALYYALPIAIVASLVAVCASGAAVFAQHVTMGLSQRRLARIVVVGSVTLVGISAVMVVLILQLQLLPWTPWLLAVLFAVGGILATRKRREVPPKAVDLSWSE